MAPRETYDPEDIESLLSERSFDELLAEERAFVLRHLNSREEYERMRELLHRVREDESSSAGEVMEPDAAVRESLLHVFRQQQTTRWRIWLNSVQAFLFPQQASAMWRPALALASVTVLVIIGVFVFQSEKASSPLAGLKKEQAPPPPAGSSEVNKETTELKSEAAKDAEVLTAEKMVPSEAQDVASRRSVDLTRPGSAWSPLADLKEEEAPTLQAAEPAPTDEAEVAGKTLHLADQQLETTTGYLDTAAPQAPTVNYVEKDQLVINESLANATGVVTMQEVATTERRSKQDRARKAEDKDGNATAESSRNLAQDDQLLELLNAAW